MQDNAQESMFPARLEFGEYIVVPTRKLKTVTPGSSNPLVVDPA